MIDMKRFLLYLLRWQLSTPILSVVTYYLVGSLGSLWTAVIANLIGGVIFYKIDKQIFKRKKTMKAINNLIGKKVIIRSYGAGVFFGTLNEVERCEDKYTVELLSCRRLWQWYGACSISQLAVEGTKEPENCKFTLTEPSIVVSSVIEIHECSENAIKSIEAVKQWKK